MNDLILFTGATGFLGSNLLRKLIADQRDIIVLKRSFSNTCRILDVLDRVKYYDIDQIKIESVFSNKIDMVIHCATDYGRENTDLKSIIDSNLILPLQLLELGRKNGLTSFLNTDTILDKRISDYSLSKSQFKEWLESRSRDMICVNIALEHFYGPFDNKSKFVSNIIGNILNGIPQVALTEGKQKRDFIFIDDVIDAFTLIIRNVATLRKGFLNYEIGTNQSFAIRELVELIKRIANNDNTILNFGAIPYREHEVMESKADISEIRKLGWEPKTSIEEGLRITIESEKRGIIVR